MSDIIIAAAYSQNGGDDPAVGLTLADIDLYLYSVKRDDGTIAAIWNTVNPTHEIPNLGHYFRIYSGADLDLYNYHARAQYTGVVSLDQNMVTGAIGSTSIPLGVAIEWPYIVYYEGTTNPIEGVKVEIYRNAAGTGEPYWTGYSNGLGEARDVYNNYPRLDPGTWYFWRKRGGIKFNNPDTEVVV